MANWIRSKFQLMMGDLSGWSYNALIVQGGTVDVTLTLDPGATIAPGSVLAAWLTDLNGVPIVSGVPLTVNGPGTYTLALNAVMNVTYQYNLYLYLFPPGEPVVMGAFVSLATFWQGSDTISGMTGNTLYAGISATLDIAPIAYDGDLAIVVTDGSGPVPGLEIFAQVVDTTAGQTVIGKSLTTSSQGTCYLTWTGIHYLVNDRFSLNLSVPSIILTPQGTAPNPYSGSTSINLQGTQLNPGPGTLGNPYLAHFPVSVVSVPPTPQITFQFLTGGPYPYNNVTVSVEPAAGGETPATGQSGATSNTAVVAIPSAWASQPLVYSWAAVGAPYGNENVPVPSTPSEVENGTAAITIEVV